MKHFISIQFILVLLSIIMLASCSSQVKKTFIVEDINIIPKPVSIKLSDGSFEFNKKTKIIVSQDSQNKAVASLVQKFNSAAAWQLEVINVSDSPESNIVELAVNDSLDRDAYRLVITDDKIKISASEFGGFLYGVQSLIQLLPVKIESKTLQNNVDWIVPNVEIQDQPRFQWRGLMLDLSRHFFDKEYIKEVIDGLAMHKMNVLHLHLLDDQGWRIEIKKYPKLTEVGAWRVDQEDAHWNNRKLNTDGEKGTYGGFLSQDDLKEIVAYAKDNNIEVVPEIEMPAHVSCAIASYPYLSCNEKHIEVPSGGVWPITDIYCAGKETTFEFLENVLFEVMEIFPSKYIHIGGDEATKTNWKTCTHCQARMKKEGLHDEEELQSYFVKRMEKFINAHGKKLIGWDEILEGGLAPEATVMSWRGVKGGLEAAAQGHDVIMTPGTHCYFDHYQGPQNEEPLAIGGYLPLSKVYKFDPIVESMTEEEANHVLGGQANLWTEYISTNSHSDYMIYPRLAALSETVWSTKESRDWDNFSNRIMFMFKRYDYQEINYAKSAYLITANTKMNMENKSVEILLQNEFPESDIRYTLNGDKLTEAAEKYLAPIQLTETTTIKASLFKNNQAIGKEFNKTIKFHKGVGKQVSYKEIYNDRYQGAGEFGMVNTLRGTKNFHDGQWQAWLDKDMEVTIALENETKINSVTVGSMENQGSGIYYPTAIEIFVSIDGKTFEKVGEIKRTYAKNGNSELKDFQINFEEKLTRYVKVKAFHLNKVPNGGSAWLFVDEILID